ncbi:hypothetical protein MAR621_03156 [Maribacter dokdonensis]|uniref:hypothetical protein n=1 Tax=Maribacter dokdonensis TaxID=320912 RepID=UPI001B15909B|nr:hypothetical protein [Maribacter dokdonensis]CAG2532962.1 hypothetical protein MAR621_03156 [Maribacter dokdonensis]
MDKEAIINRIEYLRNCLAWSLQNKQHLTDTQRICLNQERAAWHRVLTDMQLQGKPAKEPSYTIPKHLEHNLLKIALAIDSTKWNREQYELQFKSL